MKKHLLGLAIGLASLAPASYAATITQFSSIISSDVTGITNLLSALPAEYTVAGNVSRIGAIVDGNAAIATVSTLTDGQALIADGGLNQAEFNALNQFSVFNGDVLTYSLGGSFDLTRVDIYSSWNNNDRKDFNDVKIEFSTDLTGAQYFDLMTELATGGNIAIQGPGFGVDTGIFAAGDVIAAGATHVRFTFNGVDHGQIGVSELAVQGTSAVPEPSTYAAIFGVLALGAAAYSRRQSRA